MEAYYHLLGHLNSWLFKQEAVESISFLVLYFSINSQTNCDTAPAAKPINNDSMNLFMVILLVIKVN